MALFRQVARPRFSRARATVFPKRRGASHEPDMPYTDRSWPTGRYAHFTRLWKFCPGLDGNSISNDSAELLSPIQLGQNETNRGGAPEREGPAPKPGRWTLLPHVLRKLNNTSKSFHFEVPPKIKRNNDVVALLVLGQFTTFPRCCLVSRSKLEIR